MLGEYAGSQIKVNVGNHFILDDWKSPKRLLEREKRCLVIFFLEKSIINKLGSNAGIMKTLHLLYRERKKQNIFLMCFEICTDKSTGFIFHFFIFRDGFSRLSEGIVIDPEESQQFGVAHRELLNVTMRHASVVVTTLCNPGDYTLYEYFKPSVIIMDEASRATELDMWNVRLYSPIFLI